MRSISGVITQVSGNKLFIRLETGTCITMEGSGSVYDRVQVTFDMVRGKYRYVEAEVYDDVMEEPEPVAMGESRPDGVIDIIYVIIILCIISVICKSVEYHAEYSPIYIYEYDVIYYNILYISNIPERS
jgi:hypothetical protein